MALKTISSYRSNVVGSRRVIYGSVTASNNDTTQLPFHKVAMLDTLNSASRLISASLGAATSSGVLVTWVTPGTNDPETFLIDVEGY